MRHHVPFVGERKLVRADDEQARAKRTGGRAIDDIVADEKAESSWEDVVPAGWPDAGTKRDNLQATGASIAMPQGKTKEKSAVAPGRTKTAAKPQVSASPISFSDSACMDWVHINNGRGLRVSIHGNIDGDLRKEWSRLLNDTESAEIKEFEFNLSDTPALSLIGLGMLLLFKERKGSKRNDIRLCNCNKEVAQLLQWTGMEKYFAIENTQITHP